MAANILVFIKLHSHYFYCVIHPRNPEKFDTWSILYPCILLPWTFRTDSNKGMWRVVARNGKCHSWLAHNLSLSLTSLLWAKSLFVWKMLEQCLLSSWSLTNYRLCNNRHTLRTDCSPLVWDSSHTAGHCNREMFSVQQNGSSCSTLLRHTHHRSTLPIVFVNNVPRQHCHIREHRRVGK